MKLLAKIVLFIFSKRKLDIIDVRLGSMTTSGFMISHTILAVKNNGGLLHKYVCIISESFPSRHTGATRNFCK